ncbi:MAG: hypothetical protein J5658_03115 [Prevotella sp.]|nr:hypothetical protein [Prevotella sp.]
MGKNSIRNNGTRLTVLLLAVLISTQHANAYWRWNYDWKTVIQVGANTTAAAAVEEAHNLTLDEQRKKQERIAEYTTAIHLIRELYKESMQNTSGFDQESMYYRLIGENALYIVTNIPVAISWLSKNPAINLPLCLNEISNLTMKTEQCIAGFVNIVNNGHVSSPLKANPLIPRGGGRANIGKDDGYNFMSRADRMGMANDILEDLVIVRNNLDYIIFICQTNNGLEDLLMELDPDTWCTAMQMKWSVDEIVRGWEDFS